MKASKFDRFNTEETTEAALQRIAKECVAYKDRAEKAEARVKELELDVDALKRDLIKTHHRLVEATAPG